MSPNPLSARLRCSRVVFRSRACARDRIPTSAPTPLRCSSSLTCLPSGQGGCHSGGHWHGLRSICGMAAMPPLPVPPCPKRGSDALLPLPLFGNSPTRRCLTSPKEGCHATLEGPLRWRLRRSCSFEWLLPHREAASPPPGREAATLPASLRIRKAATLRSMRSLTKTKPASTQIDVAWLEPWRAHQRCVARQGFGQRHGALVFDHVGCGHTNTFTLHACEGM